MQARGAMRRYGAVRRGLMACAAAAIAGCGGSGGGGDARCDAAVPVVQLFGDSTMWGQDGARRDFTAAAVTPASALQAWLDARRGVGRVRVDNRAVSGTDSRQLLAGDDGVNAPWPQSVHAAVVVVNFGINDKERDLGEAQYRANLRALAAVPAGVQVLFQTPLPVLRVDGNVSTSYAEFMRAEAAALGLPVADASAWAMALGDWFARLAPDTVHPVAEGYARLVTDVLGPAVLPLLPPPQPGC